MFHSIAFLNREEGLQGQQQRNQRVDVVVHSKYKTEQVDMAMVLPSFTLEAPYSNISPFRGYADRNFVSCY